MKTISNFYTWIMVRLSFRLRRAAVRLKLALATIRARIRLIRCRKVFSDLSESALKASTPIGEIARNLNAQGYEDV